MQFGIGQPVTRKEDPRFLTGRARYVADIDLARQAYAALSRNRQSLSRWMSSTDPGAVAAELRNVVLEPCALPVGNLPTSNIRDYLQ